MNDEEDDEDFVSTNRFSDKAYGILRRKKNRYPKYTK